MAWWKPRRLEEVIHYPGSEEVEEYVYTPGLHGVELAKALKQGKILGMKCPDGTRIVPPLTYCPDGSPGELIEVHEPWRIITYTVIHTDIEGRPLPEPEIVALIAPEGYAGGLYHRVKTSPDKLRIGLRVRPVFRPENERTGRITDILYFEPLE